MKHIMWLIVAMFVIGIFFWYGKVGSISNIVANINGTKIKIDEYQKNVTQQLRRLREGQDEELSDEQIFQMRRQVLSSMITQEVLFITSKKMGIIVTDEEIINTIHNLPQFQQNERFNFDLYMQTLRFSLNSTPEEFEVLIRKNIANRKLERLILSSAKVTGQELKMHYLNKYGSLGTFDKTISEELKNTILQNKRTALYKNWMNTLQQNTKIKVNPKLAGLSK